MVDMSCHSDWPRDERQDVEHARRAARDTRRFGITLAYTGSFGITLGNVRNGHLHTRCKRLPGPNLKILAGPECD